MSTLSEGWAFEPAWLQWYALKVFYNRIDTLKSYLPEGMKTYVPVQVVEEYKNGRLRYEEKQLIPSLLFLRCDGEWLEEFKSQHKELFLYYTGPRSRHPGAIPDEEMHSFILVTSANGGRGVSVFSTGDYRTGDRVRVTGGIYKGAEGYIKRIKKDRKLIVSVTGVAVVAVSHIDPAFLEKIA